MFQQRGSMLSLLSARARLAPKLLVLLGLCLALTPGAAAAADMASSVFTVKDVPVDTTAATATVAKEHAIIDGQRLAFQRLLARLTLPRDATNLPKLSDSDLTDLTEGFEVQQEKTSAVRYIATLTYHFKQRAIEQLLRDKSIPFAETVSKPVLVLPVLRSGNALALWDDPNPWRAAWSALPPADGLVPFIVPIGDISDMADIKADEVVKADREKLAKIAARYGAGSELVAVATLGGNLGGNPGSVSVAVSRYGDGLQDQTVVTSVSAQPGEALNDLFARAARQIESDTTERWKEDNLLHFDQAQQAVMSVPISGLDDWVKVRQRLEQVPLISRTQLVFLSRSEARIDVSYIGDPSQLKMALAQRDLMLTDNQDGGFVLRLNTPGATAGAPSQ